MICTLTLLALLTGTDSDVERIRAFVVTVTGNPEFTVDDISLEDVQRPIPRYHVEGFGTVTYDPGKKRILYALNGSASILFAERKVHDTEQFIKTRSHAITFTTDLARRIGLPEDWGLTRLTISADELYPEGRLVKEFGRVFAYFQPPQGDGPPIVPYGNGMLLELDSRTGVLVKMRWMYDYVRGTGDWTVPNEAAIAIALARAVSDYGFKESVQVIRVERGFGRKKPGTDGGMRLGTRVTIPVIVVYAMLQAEVAFVIDANTGEHLGSGAVPDWFMNGSID